MIPKDKNAPLKDMKKPIDKKVPRAKATIKTLTILINIASTTPISYRVIRIMMLAKPNLTPGMPILGIKDSKKAITIAKAVNIAIKTIRCVLINQPQYRNSNYHQ